MTTAELQIPSYIVGSWVIDTVHSHVGFVIRHLVVSKVHGSFRAITAKIITAPNPIESSVTAEIQVSSIDTKNETRDEHIRSADFFDAEHHPTLTFASTGIRYDNGDFFVDGDLTIRGITKPITLNLETPAFGPNPQGGTKAGLSATTEINRNDFDVSYNGPSSAVGSPSARRSRSCSISRQTYRNKRRGRGGCRVAAADFGQDGTRTRPFPRTERAQLSTSSQFLQRLHLGSTTAVFPSILTRTGRISMGLTFGGTAGTGALGRRFGVGSEDLNVALPLGAPLPSTDTAGSSWTSGHVVSISVPGGLEPVGLLRQAGSSRQQSQPDRRL